MNGPQVREWAEALASRLQADTPNAENFHPLIFKAYARALGREPSPLELDEASDFLQAQFRRYGTDEKSDARFLALTDFCQVLFGLNEFAYEN